MRPNLFAEVKPTALSSPPFLLRWFYRRTKNHTAIHCIGVDYIMLFTDGCTVSKSRNSICGGQCWYCGIPPEKKKKKKMCGKHWKKNCVIPVWQGGWGWRADGLCARLIVINVEFGFYLPWLDAQVEPMYGRHWRGRFKKTDREKKKNVQGHTMSTCDQLL